MSRRPVGRPEEDFHSFTGFMSKFSVVENFAKILKPKTHTPKFSRNIRPEPRKFRENFESQYKIVVNWIFNRVGRRPGGPETQTNISIHGGQGKNTLFSQARKRLIESNGGAF
jgi:hypothetical protein